ncbi:MAG: helix-turn-helix transcriptional regulator [Erysipelotrichaceae bacterium]|nr:helix-turn-helix transcriptional regulator [Erysipelotrichaceae bacterium]
MESFGARLAELRRQHNLTQNDIADRLNISAQAVSNWENDLTSPDIDTLLKLADIFNISTDELLGKNKIEPVYLPTEQRKDINQLVFRIIVDSVDGDRVRINLPMAAVKIFVNNDSVKIFSGNKALENIDFNQIFALVEQGVIGELVSVDSADGDHVRILVESI